MGVLCTDVVNRVRHTDRAEGASAVVLSAQHCGRMGCAGREMVSVGQEGSVTGSAPVLVPTAKEINNL